MLAATAWFVLGVDPAAVGLGALLVGLVAVALGIASVRGAARGSSDWWMGIVGAVVGAIPLATVILLVIGAIFGWVEFR